MSSFSNVSHYLPKFSKYLTEKSAEQCIDKMLKKNEAQKDKQGKTFVKFFDKALERNEWKSDQNFKSLLDAAVNKGSHEVKKFSKKSKAKFIKLAEVYKKTLKQLQKNEEDTLFQSLEKELNSTDLQKTPEKAKLKELLQKGLEKNLSRTFSVLKTMQKLSSEATRIAVETFKEMPQMKAFPENTAATLVRIASSFDLIQASNSQKKSLKAKEVLAIAILSQYEIPKIQTVCKRVLGGVKKPEENWIAKKTHHLSHDLLLNPKKKKIYIIGTKLLGEGSFKKVLPSIGFTMNKDLTLTNPKLYAFAYTSPGHGVKDTLKIEQSVITQAKDIPTALKVNYAEVSKTKKGPTLRLVTELCDGDLESKSTHFSKSERVKAAKDVIDSVAALHKKGFTHGDLKPANFLVKDKRAKLTDFGTAWPIAMKNPCPFNSYGTFYYNSPETLSFQNHPKQTFVTDDAYALGLVLWELATSSDIAQLLEKEVTRFDTYFDSGKPLPKPDMKKLKWLEEKIRTVTEASIQDFSLQSDKLEDKALVSVMQIAAQLMQPIQSRMTVQQAAQAFNQIHVT